MDQLLHESLAGWDSFYVIAGSVAGALIGLQFVVIALIAESRRRTSLMEIQAFGTPTVIHFCAALLLSALLSAPWHSATVLQVTLVGSGVAGVVYVVIVIRRALRSPKYRPELEDWVWHVALPLAAYLTLLVAAVFLSRLAEPALSLIAAVTLGLVFIGIHNAWDTITFVATGAEHGVEKDKH